MGLFVRFKLPGHYRVTFTLAKTVDIYGVNSELTDGRHILMWDFDGVSLERVKRILSYRQGDLSLPKIHIFQSRADGMGFHAYCFQCCAFSEAVSIVADTAHVDWDFVKWAVIRGRFTLRLSPKGGYIPHEVAVLPSVIADNSAPEDMRSYVRYETLERIAEQHGY